MNSYIPTPLFQFPLEILDLENPATRPVVLGYNLPIDSSPKRSYQVLSLLRDAVLIFNKESRCAYINQAAARMLATEPETAQNQRAARIFLDFEGSFFEKEMKRVQAGGVVSSFHSHCPSTGRYFLQDIHSFGGGTLIFISDVTHTFRLKALEAECVSTRQLLASLMHDIRSPLNALVSLKRLIIRPENAERRGWFLDQIETYVNAIISLTSKNGELSKLRGQLSKEENAGENSVQDDVAVGT